MTQRYIVTWRKPAPNVLDWGHCTCEDLLEVERVIQNLLAQKVHQYHTFELGPQVPSLSSAY
jgi:hypothetical protein